MPPRHQNSTEVPIEPGTIPTARVIIADDHHLVAEGLRRLIEPPHSVVAVVHSAADLLAALAATPADCLLLDLVMPGGHGLPLLPVIRERRPTVKVVVVSMLVEPVIVEACFRGGAHAFVPKNAEREDLLDGIAAALEQRPYRSPGLPRTAHGVGLDAACPGLERLTPRQEHIFRMLGAGRRPSQIAEVIGLSRSTVTFHLGSLMRALGAPSLGALIRLAVLHAPPAVGGGRG
jgi:DNA-binding NarL/FixJ family response regulator